MTNDSARVSETAPCDQYIIEKQAASILKSQSVSFAVNTILAISVVLGLIGRYSTAVLIAWLSGIIIVNFFRYALPRLSAVQGMSIRRARQELELSWKGALASGLFWAAFRIYAGVVHPETPAIVDFILAGISAGAVVQGTAHSRTTIAFIVPVLLTLCVTSLGRHGIEGVIYAIDATMYTVVLIRSAINGDRTFRQTIRMMHDAVSAAAELETSHREVIAASAKLDLLANRDSLTALANRGAFASALARRLETASAEGGSACLLLLDLDGFKTINDTLGHAAGDLVLIETAARIKAAAGDTNLPARLGGDEFAVILGDDHDGVDVATSILAAIRQPMMISGRRVEVGICIGAASYPHDGETLSELMASADLALYAAKEGGRNRMHHFEATLQAAIQRRREIERDLAQALKDGSIEVWFQPQVSLMERRLVGIEALIRWRHPRHGWISPPVIVTAALATRHCETLTGLVLASACDLIQELEQAGRSDVIVAINVSPRELAVYSLPELVATTLANRPVKAAQLEIEITEEALIADKSAMQELNALKDLGVRLAIDDFGTGYSSLAYLSSLRVDRIKIDRCFVAAMSQTNGDRVLIQAILGIGRELGLEVVVEGVETTDEALRLVAYGGRTGQGYLFGVPMPRPLLDQWIKTNQLECSQSEAVRTARAETLSSHLKLPAPHAPATPASPPSLAPMSRPAARA